jgi:predicted RNase H-like nuclease (RuvC/YqgF family)
MPEYPSRLSSGQNYSYYRYHRRVVSNPASSVPYRRTVFNRSPYAHEPAAYRDPSPHVQNSAQTNMQVFEEEIREEFRSWDSSSGSEAKFGSPEIFALENEISEIKEMVRNIAEKISFPSATGRESRQKTPDTEKVEALKKELKELKALLEQFRKKG